MSTPHTPIHCPVHQAALEAPARPAIAWGFRRITYAQLDHYVTSAVRAFKERGVKTGHRVALIGENSVEYVIALLGLWRLGAIALPINSRFPLSTIFSLLSSHKAQAVVTDRTFSFSGSKPGCAHIIFTDLIHFDAKDVLSTAEPSGFALACEQEAVIILTSGTTAGGKSALLTYGNLYWNALGSNECIPVGQGDAWLLSLPLYHVSGLGIVMRCLIARALIVVAPKDDSLQLVADGKVTHVSLVAAQLYRWLNGPDFKKSDKLKAVLLGGSSLPKNLLQSALDQGLPVFVSYGLTEMASQVATGRLADVTRSPARVLSYRELKIERDGEICVRGETLFKGYVHKEQMERPLDADGWFHTGDVGSLDKDGGLSVIGRKDNMFISGGENIHPEEIEAVLLKIKGLAQAVVVPQDDEEFGRRPVAFVGWNDGVQMSELKIREFLNAQLPKFKVPVKFYTWPADTNDQGLKVNRRQFEELAKNAG